jgi:methylmalonyl-CoA mutase N-terminal domain/subunit
LAVTERPSASLRMPSEPVPATESVTVFESVPATESRSTSELGPGSESPSASESAPPSESRSVAESRSAAERLPAGYEEWRQAYGLDPERDALFTTLSGEPVQPLYTPADLPEDPDAAIGLPGRYPFTRGVYPSMYRGRLWTMRQFAGFGTAEETNARFRYLLDHGQTGLSTAFDMPSLMGHDSDHPRSLGEVGREGVAIDTVEDMRTLFAGIDLGRVSVSMTINAPAAIMLAYYVVAAEEAGVPPDRLSGTIQADILKEYIAQKEWCFPIDPAMRLLGDMVEWCTRHMPRWHPVSISGYHIREAGATAAQELAFTLKDGLTYVEQAIARGLDVDDFAPRLSFFFNAQIDFFEEIAKYRAARRIWARELRQTFGAKNPRSWLMRFHTQTAGVSLTAQQPLNNIVRTAIEALAGVLGGTQSLHTNSYDEALALPTEEAVRIALRTQQIIAHETGVTNTIDPLGGSYFVEALTDRIERQAYDYFDKIDQLGGMVEAVKQGYPQREIADAAFALQREIESGRRIVVGVNAYTDGDGEQTPILRIDPSLERKQIDRLNAVRARRDINAVEAALGRIRQAARHEHENLMPHLLEAARARVSEGEIVQALQAVWGSYRESPFF